MLQSGERWGGAEKGEGGAEGVAISQSGTTLMVLIDFTELCQFDIVQPTSIKCQLCQALRTEQ